MGLFDDYTTNWPMQTRAWSLFIKVTSQKILAKMVAFLSPANDCSFDYVFYFVIAEFSECLTIFRFNNDL